MIRLEVKKCNKWLLETQQKHHYYQRVKLTDESVTSRGNVAFGSNMNDRRAYVYFFFSLESIYKANTENKIRSFKTVRTWCSSIKNEIQK